VGYAFLTSLRDVLSIYLETTILDLAPPLLPVDREHDSPAHEGGPCEISQTDRDRPNRDHASREIRLLARGIEPVREELVHDHGILARAS
jgi:hypothetical protein